MPAVAKIQPTEVQPATDGVSYATLETVLGTGDLSKLNPQQRVEYVEAVCRSIGVNPLTRPFEFLTLQGKTVMYARKDLTEQLRNLKNITLQIVGQEFAEEVFIVTAAARMPSGREDQDMGAVPLPATLKGEARANAIMKAITKAKRRVTLSICGLGFLDESELDGVPQEAPPQPLQSAPVRPAAPPMPALNAPEKTTSSEEKAEKWLNSLARKLATCTTSAEIDAVHNRLDVQGNIQSAPPDVAKRISDLFVEAIKRVKQTKPADHIADDGWPGPDVPKQTDQPDPELDSIMRGSGVGMTDGG